MSGLFPKPGDRSKIGMKGNVYQGGYTLTRLAASCGSLNLGLADFAWRFDKQFPAKYAFTCPIIYKYAALLGYMTRIFEGIPNNSWRYLFYGGGVDVTIAHALLTPNARHIIWLFGDRDGNGYAYCDGTLISTNDISAAAAINLDNAGDFSAHLNTTLLRAGDLYGIYMYNFGVGGLPDAATRALIVAQDMANPYLVPPALSSRPNYATEERLRITFSDCDPAWTYIPDESPQANNLTIAGGLTCAQVLKEVGTV